MLYTVVRNLQNLQGEGALEWAVDRNVWNWDGRRNRRMRNGELHNLYSSPNRPIVGVIKSWRVRWVGRLLDEDNIEMDLKSIGWDFTDRIHLYHHKN
jgi:hypothetical protein